MALSWVLIILILLILLAEMYFIGKYISIRQDIFGNKVFSIFSMGAMVYLFITFVFFLPFVWLKLNLIYFVIVLLLKDFFTFVFLISRREVFRGMKVNYVGIGFIVGSAILITLIQQFAFPHFLTMNWTGKINDYHMYNRLIASVDWLTKINNITYTTDYLFTPLVGAIIFSITTSVFLAFSKRDSWIDYTISFFITIGAIILLCNNLLVFELLPIFSFLLLFIYGYNLIMFSRRRYGSLFGVVVIVTWCANPWTYWALLFTALAVAITYIFLQKPKASLFAVQLLSPIALISTLKIVEVSRVLSIILFIIAVVVYMYVFIAGRVKFIEDANKWVVAFKWIIPATVVGIIIIIATVYGIHDNAPIDVVYLENKIVNTFDNRIFDIVQNVIYYVAIALLIAYTGYLFLTKKKIVKFNLVIYITTAIFLIGFNPAFKIILLRLHEETRGFVEVPAVLPIMVVSLAYLRNMTIKKIAI